MGIGQTACIKSGGRRAAAAKRPWQHTIGLRFLPATIIVGWSLEATVTAFDAQIDLGHVAANGEHAITRENRTARKQTSALPVRQTQFRLVERVLTINPTGDAVANKRRVDGVVEALLRHGIVADQRYSDTAIQRYSDTANYGLSD